MDKRVENGKGEDEKTKEWFEFQEIPKVIRGDGMLEV